MSLISQIYLIVDKICESSEFETLKTLRLVNKSWNSSSNSVLRKRCRKFEPTTSQLEFLSSPNFNEDISANLPFSISYDAGNCESLLNDPWRSNVVSLSISKLTARDSHVVPILLKSLPTLKKLHIVHILPSEQDFELCPTLFSAASIVKDGATFPMLQEISFTFGSGESEEFTFFNVESFFVYDLSFLRQCPFLKKFSLDCYFVRALKLLQRWIQMYEEDPTNLGPYQQLKFNITGPMFDWFDEEEKLMHPQFLDAISKFINLNRPTSLNFQKSHSLDFPALFAKFQSWTPAIHSLTIQVPAADGRNWATTSPSNSETHDGTHEMLTLLKTFSVFAELTHICLTAAGRRRPDRQLSAERCHALSVVVSLELQHYNGFPDRLLLFIAPAMLRQAAVHLTNVSRLSLRGLLIGSSHIELSDPKIFFQTKAGFTAVLESCQRFRELRHLELKVKAREKFACESILAHKVAANRGYFQDISILKGLETFKAKVVQTQHELANRNQIFSILFQDYKPQVSLDLLWIDSFAAELKPLPKSSVRYKMSVEEFENAVQEAESARIDS